VEGTVSGARDADTSNFAHNSAVYVRTFREGGKIIERNGMGGNVCVMYFYGRVKSSKKSVDESFGRNLSSFIIKKISIDIDLVFSFITLSFWNL
jgi:hypothetical protein